MNKLTDHLKNSWGATLKYSLDVKTALWNHSHDLSIATETLNWKPKDLHTSPYLGHVASWCLSFRLCIMKGMCLNGPYG